MVYLSRDFPCHRFNPKPIERWRVELFVCVRVWACACMRVRASLLPFFALRERHIHHSASARSLPANAPGPSTLKTPAVTKIKMTVERIFDELGHFKRYRQRFSIFPKLPFVFLKWLSMRFFHVMNAFYFFIFLFICHRMCTVLKRNITYYSTGWKLHAGVIQ